MRNIPKGFIRGGLYGDDKALMDSGKPENKGV